MTKRTYSTKASYEGAVRNALVQMQSHDRGMGDIFKNSKDEYERLNLDKEDCLAILFFKNGTNNNSSKIGYEWIKSLPLNKWNIPEPDINFKNLQDDIILGNIGDPSLDFHLNQFRQLITSPVLC